MRRSSRLGVLAMVVTLLALNLGVGSVSALASDTQLFADDFESGTLANWQVVTGGNGAAQVLSGAGLNGTRGVRITVPDYTSNSIAYIKKTLDQPVYALSAAGDFNVLAGGCDPNAGYSQGDVPFFRFFDTSGKRVLGLYRINGSCNKVAKLYVQYSGNFYRTGKNLSVNDWNHLELRATVSTRGQSLVQVYVNNSLVFSTSLADNGLLPIGSVVVGNEHQNQVGDFEGDNIRLATFAGGPPPTNTCTPSTPAPTTTDPGTVVLADNFESADFSKWTSVTINGDATATVQSTTVHSGTCAAQIHVSASSDSRANLSKTLPAGTNEVWADGWFNIQAQGASTSSNVPFLRLFSGGARIVDLYRQNGNGLFYLRTPNGSGSWTYTSLKQTLSLNTWYEVKVHTIANGNASTVEVWLNGTRVYATTAATLGVTAYDTAMVYSEHFAQEGNLVADDIVIKVGH